MTIKQLLWVATACLSTSLATAQTASTGALRGVVTDPRNAAIAGAQVTLTSAATGEVRHAISGGDGGYDITLLPAGAYKLQIGAAGFKTVVAPHVLVVVTEITNLDLPLGVGEVSDTVEVTSEGSVLQTDSSSIGSTVNSETLTSLPLVKRNYTEVMDLSPGVSQDVNNALVLGRGTGSVITGGISSMGSRPGDNNFEINGADANDFGASNNGYTAGTPVPNPDAIQEFRVQVSGADASYGRDAGANVNVITKSGTNKFHGSLFEYFKNEAMDANDYFFKQQEEARPEVRQNQFGGTVGGPIHKDKVFFFGSYQGTRQTQSYSATGSRASCSSNYQGAPYLTNDNRTAAGLGATFGGARGVFGLGANVANDGSNINPVALTVLNYKLPNGQYLIPNSTVSGNPQGQAATTAGSFLVADKCVFNEDQYPASIDYVQSERSQFSVKTFYARSFELSPFPLATVSGYPLDLSENFFAESVQHTFAITPKLLNQFIAGYVRLDYNGDSGSAGNYASFGINAPTDNNVQLFDFGGLIVGQSLTTRTTENNYTLRDDLSYSLGRHNLRIGGGLEEERTELSNYRQSDFLLYLSFADFLIGQDSTYCTPGTTNCNGVGGNFGNIYASYGNVGDTTRETRELDGNLYLQDDWKLTPRLTLNLGMRLEYLGPISEAKGKIVYADFNKLATDPSAAGSLQGFLVPKNFPYAIPSGVINTGNNSASYELGKWNPAPRLGFAYQVQPRVVLRGAAGLYYVHANFQNISNDVGTPPFGASPSTAGGANGAATSQNPYIQPYVIDSFKLGQFIPYSPTNTLAVFVQDPHYRPGRIAQYSLDSQMQLTPNTVLDIAYLGKRGNNIQDVTLPNQAGYASPANPIRGQTINTVANTQQRAFTTGFPITNFQYSQTDGAFWYDGLGVNLTRRMSRGLQVITSYTWSKSLDTSFGNAGATSDVLGDYTNKHQRYGQTSFNRPQRFVLAANYELPQTSFGNHFTRSAENGWSVSTVVTVQGGNPLVLAGTNSTNYAGITGSDRDEAEVSCPYDQVVTKGDVKKKLKTYFNTSCVSSVYPASPDGGGTTLFGNARPGMVSGPGQHDTDLSLAKKFSFPIFAEQTSGEFRVQAFNVFNTAQFANPGVDADQGTFGTINSTSVSARVLQLALRLSF